jgi:hypothetical protein
MGNPRTTAIVSAIAIVLIGANMLLNNGEAPSPTLAIVQWIFLGAAVVALIGSLVLMSRK